MRTRREDHTEATRTAILRAGRRRFGRHGYAAASMAEIARDARVTTGAVYHHFAGKPALFLAVAEQVEAELLDLAMAVEADDPWKRLETGFEALVDACSQDDVQQIIFVDAPRVVGLEAWREVELKYAYGALSASLRQLAGDGVIRPYPLELIAPVLLSLLVEASRAVAATPHVRPQALDLIRRMLAALRA